MKKLSLMAGVTTIVATSFVMTATATASPAVERYKQMLGEVGSGGFVCNDSFTDRVNERLTALVPNVCAQLNTEPTLDGHPFAYDNPQAACDMGQGMVGAPSWDGFNWDVNGADACGIAKMVVGDHIRGAVGQWNNAMDMINGITSGSGSIDFGGAIENIIGN